MTTQDVTSAVPRSEVTTRDPAFPGSAQSRGRSLPPLAPAAASPRLGSLCSGYEGLGMAVMNVLGGELAWVADNDKGAATILAHHFPDVPNLGDIKEIDWAHVTPVEVFLGGFPCQDISCAGGRTGLRAGNRTGLWAYLALAISVLRPSLVVLENVRGLLSGKTDGNLEWCSWCLGDTEPELALRALGAVLGDLADLGFDADWVTVSASDVGAPHRRERVFITAWASADTPRYRRGRSRQRVVDDGARAAWHVRFGADATAAGPAQDSDGAAGDQRWQPAPGQAESRRPRSDAGGPGGASAAADTAGARQARTEDSEADRDGADPGRRSAEPERDGCARVAADTERGARDRRPDEQVGGQDRGTAAAGDSEIPVGWGPYEPAIRRWESVLGRPAPRPVEPGLRGERLSPRFVEWMMGLPDGWVTGIPGLSRNAQLKALGNGVVPQQAELALRILLADIPLPESIRGAA